MQIATHNEVASQSAVRQSYADKTPFLSDSSSPANPFEQSDSVSLSTRAKESAGDGDLSTPPEENATPPGNNTIIDQFMGRLSSLKSDVLKNIPGWDADSIGKKAVLTSMISDQTGNDKNREKLANILSQYPRELLQMVADSGVKIEILKDSATPGTSGDGEDAPTDLGFGDKNNDGTVDLANGEGKTSDGRDWNKVAGGYDPENDLLYVKESTLSGSDYGNFVGLHEFGHAVDDCMAEKDPGWSKKIEGFYNDAKSKGEFIDQYAQSNKKEFFAQNMAAYFLSSGAAPNPATDKFEIGNVNRDNLLKKDPDMFAFISTDVVGSTFSAVA
ncbi:MAG: hypothetical protein AB2L14_17690 [Candidatus Xenobiia bacterium LiM19]